MVSYVPSASAAPPAPNTDEPPQKKRMLFDISYPSRIPHPRWISIRSQHLRTECVATWSFCDNGCVGRRESYAPLRLTPRTSPTGIAMPILHRAVKQSRGDGTYAWRASHLLWKAHITEHNSKCHKNMLCSPQKVADMSSRWLVD